MIKVFSFWRFVVSVGFAKSWLWSLSAEKDDRVLLFSIHKVSRGNDSALSLVILPISITVGFVK